MRADRHAFFLDLDGSLVEYALTPEAGAADASLLELLALLSVRSGGALAVVSGRSIASLDGLLRPLKLPAAGLYGFERRNAAGARTQRASPGPQTLRTARRRMAELAAQHSGVELEDKGCAIALHYRRVPHLEEVLVAAVTALGAELDGALEVQRGNRLVELRPRGVSKAAAVAEFMSEPPFSGRQPLFVGDDVADEPAFEWVNAAGGLSLAVNVARPTAAVLRLGSVAEARAWLRACLENGSERP